MRDGTIARKIIAALVVGTFTTAACPVWAQTPTPPKPAAAAGEPNKNDLVTAKKDYASGEKKHKAGDFAGALADFKAANDIKPTAQAERYIGMCEDSLSHPVAAVEWYEKFLTHVPDKMQAQGDEIRKRVTELKALHGKVHVESNPPGASVSIDGQAQTTPTPMDADLAPGQHTVKLTAEGHLPAEKTVDVTFASTQTTTTELEAAPPPEPPAPPPPVVAVAPPPPPPPAPPPPPPEPRSKVPAYVTGAIAVAAAGVGTVFGVLALQDKSDFDKNPTTSKADDGDTHSLISDMAFGVAITFGVTSAILFFTKDEPPPTAAPAPAAAPAASADVHKKQAIKLTPVPMVGPHSGGAGFLLQF